MRVPLLVDRWSERGPVTQIRQTLTWPGGCPVPVTGGVGYFGSQTVSLLRKREDVVLDSTEFGHRAAVGDVPLVEGNVGDKKAVAEALEQYGNDSDIHLAAYESPGKSMS